MNTAFEGEDRRSARLAAFGRHPEYETPRDRQRRPFESREEIAAQLDHFNAMSRRLQSARIIESGWPC